MPPLSRREFLGDSGRKIFILGGATALARRPVRATPASEKVRIAAIGVGGRGSSLIRGFVDRGDCQIPVIGDLDPSRGHDLVKYCHGKQKTKPERILDYRRVLDRKDVDAVTVATPDHWHGPMTIYACMAGKDVYVEKPPSHNVWEGRRMVAAARHFDRVVQVGTQNRSAPYVKKALEFIESGGIGKIHLTKVYNLKSGGAFKSVGDSPTPEGVDYDTWLGPAPKRAFSRSHFHGSWHHWWRYSGGDLADDGIHQLDIARWLTGVDYPTAVSGSGGKFAFPNDDSETPDTQVVSYDFPGMVLTFELTQYAPYMRKTNGQIRGASVFPHWPQNSTRIEFYGSKNLLILGRHGGGWQAFTGDGKVVAQEYGRFPDPPHKANFVDCVRTRKRPNGDIEEGHRSATLVHLGNIATRLGKKFCYDAKTEKVTDNPQAQALVKREYRAPFTVPEVF